MPQFNVFLQCDHHTEGIVLWNFLSHTALLCCLSNPEILSNPPSSGFFHETWTSYWGFLSSTTHLVTLPAFFQQEQDILPYQSPPPCPCPLSFAKQGCPAFFPSTSVLLCVLALEHCTGDVLSSGAVPCWPGGAFWVSCLHLQSVFKKLLPTLFIFILH